MVAVNPLLADRVNHKTSALATNGHRIFALEFFGDDKLYFPPVERFLDYVLTKGSPNEKTNGFCSSVGLHDIALR